MENKKWYVSGIAVAALILGCSNANTKDDEPSSNSAAASAPEVVVPSSNVNLPLVMTEGTWEVGKKDSFETKTITPGTYVVSVSDEGYGCYWARIRDFDGELDSIISNGNIAEKAIVRVSVKKTDKGLELGNGCIASKKK